VSFDLETVGVNLDPVPIDEILSFRREYYDEQRAYAIAIRRFVREQSLMSKQERTLELWANSCGTLAAFFAWIPGASGRCLGFN
jgi:hypothetical protein